MAFKFKDLTIAVAPAAGGVHCGPATIDPAAAGVHCGPATIEPAVGGTADLATLKRLLQEALARVEAQEKAQQAGSLPDTVAGTEDLERRLRGALDELAAHKKTLG